MLKVNIRLALQDEHLQAAVKKATDHSLARRARAVAEVKNWEALREEAAEIRERTLAHLDQHLIMLEERAAAKGIQVHWAVDAQAANRIIGQICRQTVATNSTEAPSAGGRVIRVVKSKSMTAEEIGLTPYLEGLGMEVVETDLGEYIVQIAGQMPSHITAPALHLSRSDIGRLFAEKLGVDYAEEPSELTAVARKVLREQFLRADVGISGVNFAVAQSGTPLMVENEGNGRLVGGTPGVQICLMGIEKVVPSWDDLMLLLELLPRSATGQRITGSVIFFNRPSRKDERDGPRELHLIILDNGRSRALADPQLRSILRCIRCGACLNVCPVYRRIGGHAYGWVYPGPLGAALAPIFLQLEKAADHPFACSLCARCSEICPVKIELHRQLLALRSRVIKSKSGISPSRVFWASWRWIMDRPELYRITACVPRLFMHDILRGHWSPNIPIWGRERSSPQVARESFAKRFQREFPENVA